MHKSTKITEANKIMRNLLSTVGLVLSLMASSQLAASYRSHCASCHGPTGKAAMAGAPDFDRPGALLQSDRSLLTRIQAGKRACPGYRGILREQEIFDVIAFIRSLGL